MFLKLFWLYLGVLGTFGFNIHWIIRYQRCACCFLRNQKRCMLSHRQRYSGTPPSNISISPNTDVSKTMITTEILFEVYILRLVQLQIFSVMLTFPLHVSEALYSPLSNTGKVLLHFCKYQPSMSSLLSLPCPLVHRAVSVQQNNFSVFFLDTWNDPTVP